MSEPQEILFIKEGSFSQQNPFVADFLRREFPSCRVRVLDVWEDALRRSPVRLIAAFAEALAGYPRSTLGRLQTPRVYASRTRAAWRLLREWRAGFPRQPVFSIQTQSLFDASLPGVPHFVYTDHTYRANFRYAVRDYVPEAPRGWFEREREIYTNAAACLVTSSFCRDSLLEDYGLAAERVAVVYCGANACRPGTGGRLARGGGEVVRILFVGLEWERKGGPELVEAVRILRRRNMPVELHAAGVSEREAGGAREGCRFYGRVGLDKVRELFAGCDIFCLPSRREPSAVVLSEALVSGLPVVATRVGGTPDRVAEGENGFLVPPCDPAALAEALGRLAADAALRRRMGAASEELGRRNFTWEAVGRRVAEEIRKRVSRL